MYASLANATAVTHIAIVAGTILGLFICFRYKRFRPWEAGILVATIVLWSYYGNCPLTILEQYFRDLAGQEANLTSVGFLPYYANKLFGIGLSSSLVQKSTFFTGGIIFAASVEWMAPFFHKEVFALRKELRKLLRKKGRKR